MLDATMKLLAARFLFSLQSRRLDSDGYEHMRKWLLTHDPNFDYDKLALELPLMIEQVDSILNDLDKQNIPWHSPDYQVWPVLVRFARMQSGGISI